MFVQAILRLKTPLMVLMVPQAAVQVDQQGPGVCSPLTGKQGNPQEPGHRGTVPPNPDLTPAIRIVIRGVQKARPGDAVIVKDYIPATEASEGTASDQ